MIFIYKSKIAPVQLSTTGQSHCDEMVRAYDHDASACLASKSTLIKARSSIYGHDKVKELLAEDQYHKCCYCEVRFGANYFGDVEHFRPKGGYQQDYNGSLEQPGYYWLAYDWDNLYFSCAVCNQEYKRNYFPLFNHVSGRAKANIREIKHEQPLLIDLSKENPEEHVTFDDDIAKPCIVRGILSERGQACITAYGLNRLALVSKRMEFLAQLKRDYLLASIDYETISGSAAESLIQLIEAVDFDEFVELVEAARARVKTAAQDNAEFAGMIRSLIRDPRFSRIDKPATAA
jgi:uncharacterized protein (TIGR02646 family)